METRSIARAATIVVLNQTAIPTPKLYDLKQKVCWMDEAYGSSKLQTPSCEVEGYYM